MLHSFTLRQQLQTARQGKMSLYPGHMPTNVSNNILLCIIIISVQHNVDHCVQVICEH